ncbi:RagB/SusD family nutrient uptake outer membrane protein [Bacteroides clarus]|uniref:RagB/SusD family nutrient uptake outer membrane protein n=1 Tax=Bacteroides clarus TaxID=626929 RepID=A0A412Y6I1_9BACE|nr:RagB/SusD family nutrient uptake outer membrane protein [Bacteroides clarus]RGV35709.1 RagB/SusD family nutrient uptake outer membrane protein [Bacteroides clarus]RGV53036.1 RagB/SusD family nutrient uptake outer membrane protein [Bacteroides clarus]
MKLFKYIITGVLGMQLLTSCVDYLDKESDTELTLPMVFEDKTRTEGWLANVYSHVPDPYWGYARKLGWDILSDDMTASERWRQWDWKVIPMLLGEWTPSTDWDGNYWSRLPQLIREANIFIENVHPLPDQGISATEVTYMKAEMRFMIAYYYYLLSNTYGPVPFKPNYIAPTDFNLADLMEGQRPYYEVVDWVDKELKEVAEILPAKYTEARKYGRATSIMCLAVRARMLLFAASPLVNGNPDYANHKNKDGENLFSTTADKTKWAYAAQACKELIDAAEAAGHKLYTEKNDDGTIDPFMSYQNLFLTRYDEGNTEILFARPGGSEYGEYEKHATPAASGGSGGLGVTQSLVDAFFMENGLPINDDNSEYVEIGYSVSDETRDNTVWDTEVNGGTISKKNTYNMYCHREPRFYITVSYNNSYFTQEKRVFNFFNGSADNPHTHDAPQNGYLIRKKISPDLNVKQGTYKYRPGIVYRLGEAYLNYAEALNESDPGNGDILVYLNKIRERAGIRQYTTGATDDNFIHVDLNDQAEMRKLIRAERRVELSCEGIRYDDLRRWKEAENVLNGDFYGMNFSGKDNSSFYVRTPYLKRVYKKAYYWFPIHQSEIDKNDKLVQSPYWN